MRNEALSRVENNVLDRSGIEGCGIKLRRGINRGAPSLERGPPLHPFDGLVGRVDLGCEGLPTRGDRLSEERRFPGPYAWPED